MRTSTSVSGHLGSEFRWLCQRCHPRAFATSTTRRQTPEAPQNSQTAATKEPKKEDKLALKPLGRPIGFLERPKSGLDQVDPRRRTAGELWADLRSYDKYQERRESILARLKNDYFDDWRKVRTLHGGKTFLANPRIWKSDFSLYFPNLVGRTLASVEPKSTTLALQGKISVVNVLCGTWADSQVKTFSSKEQNPALWELLEQRNGQAQMAHVNLEARIERRLIRGMFLPRLRTIIPVAEHNRYFLVNKEPSDAFKAQMGWINHAVGYVYLVDRHCKIRWAGSGDATDEERGYLVKALRRLIDEQAKAPAVSPTATEGFADPPPRIRPVSVDRSPTRIRAVAGEYRKIRYLNSGDEPRNA